ncbi:MAG: TMEM165/GDT1 family protein [Candidatus Izimaplasma sp.]|nr:TMEM165/GDT1 family protein [Candidatus Izimaplasma bacterium]
MVETLVRAYVLILIAELGDKTQFLAIGFATKYKIKYVIIGILIGSFLNHMLAILLGQVLQEFISLDILGMIAGLLFVLFSLWSFKAEQESSIKLKSGAALVTVAMAFFIGELGDKTQLAAIVLSSESSYPVLTLIGTVSGMVTVGALGIYIGIKLGEKLPDLIMKLFAGSLFLIFGILKLYQTIPYEYVTTTRILMLSLIYVMFAYILLLPTIKAFRDHNKTPLQKQSELLRKHYFKIQAKLEEICLNCNVCDSNACLVGYTKYVVKRALYNKTVDAEDITKKLHKDYDYNTILHGYDVLLDALKDDWDNEALQVIRISFETMLFNHPIKSQSFQILQQHRDKLKTK